MPQAGASEIVSAIARRALSLIADAGHLSLPEAPPRASGMQEAARPASQLFQQELARIGCSGSGGTSTSGFSGGSGGQEVAGSSEAECGQDGARQLDGAGAASSGRGSPDGGGGSNGVEGIVTRQLSVAQAGNGATPSTGLGPSPKAAALLARLQGFVAEHILPADPVLQAFHGDRHNPDRCRDIFRAVSEISSVSSLHCIGHTNSASRQMRCVLHRRT